MKIKLQTFFFLCITAGMLMINGCSGDKQTPIQVNDIMAPFTSTDLKGKPFSLASYRKNPVIVRFFLVDCPYCLADTPVFNDFYDKYHKKGLEIVYINNDGANVGDVENFADNLNIPFPVIYDPKGGIAKKYNVKLQPLTLVLSPEHKILAALLGGVSEEELNELLAPYLKG